MGYFGLGPGPGPGGGCDALFWRCDINVFPIGYTGGMCLSKPDHVIYDLKTASGVAL